MKKIYFRFYHEKTGCQKTAFFIFFLNAFFGDFQSKITKEKGYWKCILSPTSPTGCPKNIVHSFFKILWVLLSIMVIASSTFACILIWYSRNRIKGQISNISVQEDKEPPMAPIFRLRLQLTYRAQIQHTNT